MKLTFEDLLALTRPHQYIKNLFIFLPLFFAVKITDIELLSKSIIAFIAFSLTASSLYIFNDYKDIKEDRQHPRKRNRPLASGAVSRQQAFLVMGALLLLGFGLMATFPWAMAILAIYVSINIAYSFSLKHIAILDVTVIAVGFVLRLFIGSAVTGIQLSTWIQLMTFLLALFMALAKRRDDMLIFMETGKKTRKVINGYNLQFLDTAMAIIASVIIVTYTMYTTSGTVIARIHSENLYLTTIFVIIGILRYLQVVFVFKDSGSPTKVVLKDRFIQLTLLGWIITFVWILY